MMTPLEQIGIAMVLGFIGGIVLISILYWRDHLS